MSHDSEAPVHQASVRGVPTLAITAVGVGLVVTGLAVGAAWNAWQRWDRKRLESDPQAKVLFSPIRGEVVPVTGRDGVRIHTEVFGAANPGTIVLVHGWTCSIRFWVNQIHDLSRDHRVVAYDLRGHGRSGRGHSPDFTTDALADDLDAVLTATARPGERVTLVGHSMGAMSMVAWSERYRESVPERASGVVLTNTGIGDLVSESMLIRTPDSLSGLREPIARALLGAATRLPDVRTPVSAAAVRYIALSPGASEAQVAFCERMVIDCNPRVRGGFGKTLSRLDLYEALQHLKLPAIVLAGGADRLTPPGHATRLAEQLPELVRLEVLPGIGHMGPVEAPLETTAAIRELVAHTA